MCARTIGIAAAAVVLLAGCGGNGGPHIARQDAASLITLADQIAREAPCAQGRDIRALSTRRTALVNAHRIPAALQDSLSSAVNALVEQTPLCVPAVPAATVKPPAPKHAHKPHGHGRHKHDGGD
jgi:hypothetical protein